MMLVKSAFLSAIILLIVISEVNLQQSSKVFSSEEDDMSHSTSVEQQKRNIYRKQSHLMISGFSKIFWKYMEKHHQSLNSSSNSCIKSFSAIFKLIELGNESVPQMLAASGRLPSNLFDGTYADLGNFDQCLRVQTIKSPDMDIEFDGQYCLTFMEPNLRVKNHFNKLNNDDNNVQILHFYPHLFDEKNYLSFVIGFCVPSSCSSEEIKLYLQKALQPFSWTVLPEISCQKAVNFTESLSKAPKSQKISFYFLLSWLTLVFAATIKDFIFGRASKSTSKSVLNCFSLVNSHRALWRKPENKERSLFLDSIRIMVFITEFIMHSTLWHTILLAPYLTDRMNLGVETLTVWYLQPLMNGWMIEGLVILGGISSCMQLWNKITNKSSLSDFLPIIFKRIYSVWIPLLVIIAMEIALPLAGSGPVFPVIIGRRSEACSRNYLWSLLQFTNYLNPKEMCAQHTWSIPVELQLFIASCFLLYLYKKTPQIALICNVTLIAAGIVFVWRVFYIHNIPPHLAVLPIKTDKILDYFTKYYLRVASHVWSYFYALMLTKLIMDGLDKKISKVKVKKNYLHELMEMKATYWKWVKIISFALFIQSYSTAIWNVYQIKTSPIFNAFYVIAYQALGAIAWGLLYIAGADEFRRIFGVQKSINSISKQKDEREDEKMIISDANENQINSNGNQIASTHSHAKQSLHRQETHLTKSISRTNYIVGVLLRIMKATYFSHVFFLEWYNGARRDTLTTGAFEFVVRTIALTVASIFVGIVFYLFVLGPTEALLWKYKSKKSSHNHSAKITLIDNNNRDKVM